MTKKRSPKQNMISIIIMILFFISYAYVANIYGDVSYQYDCCKMYHSKINGIITKRGTHRSNKKFSVGIGRDSSFEFQIEKVLIGSQNPFEDEIHKGDTVIKNPKSKEITFKKTNGKTIVYEYRTCCNIIE